MSLATLAVVPARSGSKGIPLKNYRDFAGKPLWMHALDIGRATCGQTCLIRDKAGTDLIKHWPLGPLMYERPDELATDEASMLSVLQWLHGQQFNGVHPKWHDEYKWPEVYVLLQPTQPLRKPEHIKEALRLLEETKADSVVSVVQIPAHYSPDYAMAIVQRGTWADGELWPPHGSHLKPYLQRYGEERKEVTRRQDASPAYSRDGTVYAIRRETIESGSLYGSHCVPLVIPSNESCNLDTEEDWTRAEELVRRNV